MSVTTGFSYPDYTDPSTGLVLADAWIELGPIVYCAEKYAQVVADVYENEAAYIAGMASISRIMKSENFGSDNFSTYFAVSVLNLLNNNIVSQSLIYLQNEI